VRPPVASTSELIWATAPPRSAGTPSRSRTARRPRSASFPDSAPGALPIGDCAVRTVRAGEAGFLDRWVYRNPDLADRQDLFRRWFDDPTDRAVVAAEVGRPLGQVLRAFNETAPISPPVGYRYRSATFAVTAMTGVCDDVHGSRYPRFGAPITLRFYLAPSPLPQSMHEAADWNFMDAGRPGFVGYAYGVRQGPTVYLAGLQSDLAVRYAYLFQGRAATEVRQGDDVEEQLAGAPGHAEHIPLLRRIFQRHWIPVLAGGVLAWAREDPSVAEIGVLQFPMEPAEDRDGGVIRRVYRDLPERMGARERVIDLAGVRHRYAVAPLAGLAGHLGDAWAPTDDRGAGRRSGH
jgi:hypothetical protein